MQTAKKKTIYARKGKTMSKIRIMTDSASDISYADEQKYAISVIPFPITLGDRTYTSRVDFDSVFPSMIYPSLKLEITTY